MILHGERARLGPLQAALGAEKGWAQLAISDFEIDEVATLLWEERWWVEVGGEVFLSSFFFFLGEGGFKRMFDWLVAEVRLIVLFLFCFG